MVDVSGKVATARMAVALAMVTMKAGTLALLRGGGLPKGDVLAVARVAGIQAAKRTGELIPLCHPLPLESVAVDFAFVGKTRLRITATAKITGKTGVEMEALTAAAVAALTIYDMAKAADKGIVIGPIRLESKTGGKSETYRRK